jgi:hypothetical protein
LTTATQLSDIYMREVVWLHGLPTSIMSDCDPKFTSKWWHELHQIMGTKLLMFTSFHPQMDGAMEWSKTSIDQMFRVLVAPNQKDWVRMCPLVEFTINSSISSATGIAPFEVNYGCMPIMMTELWDANKVPLGVGAFAQRALRNMVVAHNAHSSKQECFRNTMLTEGGEQSLTSR